MLTSRFAPFRAQVDAPDVSLIPPNDLLGVTVVLLTCSYRGKEFIRVGYYVNNETEGVEGSPKDEEGEDLDEEGAESEDDAEDEDVDEDELAPSDPDVTSSQTDDAAADGAEAAPAAAPKHVDVNKVRRFILSDKPRVTRFAIDWQ